MKVSDVERWVATVVDRLDRGQGVEDDRVELKRRFKPAALDNARRIAGHANQARGDAILWIVGIDEDGTRHALPDDLADPAVWWPPIERCFHEEPPPMTIAHPGGLLGIGFDTTRLPFVIQHPGELREVPWREGTATRSATRFDLLRLLVPQVRIPTYTVLGGFVRIERPEPKPDADPEFHWTVRVELYADVIDAVTVPDHRCFADLAFSPHPPISIGNAWATGIASDFPFGVVRRVGPEPLRMVERGDEQLVIHGASPLHMRGFHRSIVGDDWVVPGALGSILLRIGHGSSDRVAVVSAALRPEEPEGAEVARWAVEPIEPDMAG